MRLGRVGQSGVREDQARNRGSAGWNLVSNALLTAVKLAVGVWGHSEALIADGVHSGADMLSALAVVVGLGVSGRPPDAGHNYGHAKAEAISQKVVAVFLLLAGLEVANAAVAGLRSGHLPTPSGATLWVALAAAVLKALMAFSQRRVAQRTGSHGILASSVDNQVDAVSSVVAAVGILASRLGWASGDQLAALAVAGLIVWGGVSVFSTAALDLMDPAADPKTVAEIRSAILSVPEVRAVPVLKTRMSGATVLVDVEIDVDRRLSLVDAHAIAHRVHDVILKLPRVAEATVHVNPADEEGD
jgi:cation diffusion facilitator family transporter